jgi:hypothetical protein
MDKPGWINVLVALAVVATYCWLAQLPLCATAQTDSSHIPGGEAKIPRSVLKRIRTIRPGMTREKFYKLFAPYQAVVINSTTVKGKDGKSVRAFFYVYRFASVPLIYSLGKLDKDGKPDTIHWETKEPSGSEKAPSSGTLILVDVIWTYAKGGNKDDNVGNPDDKITHISKPYLIFDIGIHA